MRFFCLLAVILFWPFHASAQNAGQYRLLKLDGQIVKWGTASFGESAILKYAFLNGPLQFDDARNCRAMAPVDGLLARNNIEKADFEAAVASAFAMWQSVAGVSFRKVDNPGLADILIGIDLENHGWAHADVKKATTIGDIAPIERSLVCLNADKAWKIGFGANRDAQDLRYTLAHEIGHAIGLNHASPSGQIMSFIYGEDFADLQSGDIQGAQTLYGPPIVANTAMATLPAPDVN